MMASGPDTVYHNALARAGIGGRSPLYIDLAPDSPPYGRVTISPHIGCQLYPFGRLIKVISQSIHQFAHAGRDTYCLVLGVFVEKIIIYLPIIGGCFDTATLQREQPYPISWHDITGSQPNLLHATALPIDQPCN